MNKNEAIDIAIRAIGAWNTQWIKEYLDQNGCHIGSFDIIFSGMKEDSDAIETLEKLKDREDE